MVYLSIASRGLAGLIFAVSAFTKLRSPSAFRSFASWLAGLPLPFVRSPATAAAMAGAEAGIVVLVAVPTTAAAGLLAAAAALAAFGAGTFIAVRRGARASCQCFGASTGLLGVRHVVRDLLLCAIAVAGATSAGARGAQPAGIALSLGTAAIAALFVLYLDDIAMLFAGTESQHH